ncbi:MAG: hypothetical protein AAF986_02015 [Pseudomonadota bacterium]
MAKKIAVAAIHGIARRAPKRPSSSLERTFSDALYKKVRARLGRRTMEQKIAWREVFWSDVLSARQERYLQEISGLTNYDRIRQFLVSGIADAAAFQPHQNKAQSAYNLIIGRVRETFAALDEDTDDNVPLIVLAHSFGSHIYSSFVWDLQQGRLNPPTPFQRMETLGQLVTFGSNIPLFTFACAPEDVHPIKFPGRKLVSQKRVTPWWLNYYDKDDVLGFPLGPIGPRYEAMVAKGELQDVQINAGGILSSWNPLSHERYWTDRQFTRPVADILREWLR